MSTETRKSFVVNATFDMPGGGEVVVQARDEGHAKELVTKMLASKKNLNIIDVYEADTSNFLDKLPDFNNPPSDATIN